MTTKTLTAKFCKAADEPGRYGDGRRCNGLALNVQRCKDGEVTKSRTRHLRFDGRPTNIGLGTYPEVTLSEARQFAAENAAAVKAGADPRKTTRTVIVRPAVRRPVGMTFEAASAAYIAMKAEGQG